jgi:hypothetical protein
LDNPQQLEHIAKYIKGLTVAVWCLVVLNVIQVGAWMIPYLAPNFFQRHLTSVGTSQNVLEDWQGLSFEEKVKRATVVLVTQNRQDQGTIRAIVKVILKKAPNTSFDYGVGDEYGPASISQPKADTRYGDGSLILLSGSPAIYQESYSIYGGSIPGLNEMPLTKVREIVSKSH